jgi:hypothetical protein
MPVHAMSDPGPPRKAVKKLVRFPPTETPRSLACLPFAVSLRGVISDAGCFGQFSRPRVASDLGTAGTVL